MRGTVESLETGRTEDKDWGALEGRDKERRREKMAGTQKEARWKLHAQRSQVAIVDHELGEHRGSPVHPVLGE